MTPKAVSVLCYGQYYFELEFVKNNEIQYVYWFITGKIKLPQALKILTGYSC